MNHSTNKRETLNSRTEGNWEFIAKQLRNSKCSTIEEFYLNLDIPKQTFYDAIHKYDCMKQAHIYKLEMIGINREKLCIKKNLGMNTVAAQSLPDYLERWEKNVDRKNKQQSAGTIKIVQVPDL